MKVGGGDVTERAACQPPRCLFCNGEDGSITGHQQSSLGGGDELGGRRGVDVEGKDVRREVAIRAGSAKGSRDGDHRSRVTCDSWTLFSSHVQHAERWEPASLTLDLPLRVAGMK